jgi:hypothetical protein
MEVLWVRFACLSDFERGGARRGDVLHLVHPSALERVRARRVRVRSACVWAYSGAFSVRIRMRCASPVEMPGQRMDGDALHCGRVERCKGVANRIQVMRLKENGMKVDQWSEIHVRFYYDIEFSELFKGQ